MKKTNRGAAMWAGAVAVFAVAVGVGATLLLLRFRGAPPQRRLDLANGWIRSSWPGRSWRGAVNRTGRAGSGLCRRAGRQCRGRRDRREAGAIRPGPGARRPRRRHCHLRPDRIDPDFEPYRVIR